MKIGILTQPLHANYGGLLQAYALQTTLQKMGHDAIIINREYSQYENPVDIPQSRVSKALDFIKYYIKVLVGRPAYLMVPRTKLHLLWRNAKEFLAKYYTISPTLYTDKQLIDYYRSANFDCLIVGSDQVWRPAISPNIYNYFFDFAEEDNLKKLAYAASFGVNKWEFTEEQTYKCSRLAKLFDAISVRESSGVSLCKDYLGVEAYHVLDPTFLLEKEDYIEIINKEHEPISDGSLYYYILDSATSKMTLIKEIASKYQMKSYSCNFKGYEKCYRIGHFEDSVYPPTTKWLRGFLDAKMVLTDSFHGAVFSIIFNKPFWVIGNKERGMARFESLLGLFGLEDRLIDIENYERVDFQMPIDWTGINNKKLALKEASLAFLVYNLK